MRYPDRPLLVHVGLHKTATSALQSAFFTPQHGFQQILGRGPLLRMFVDKASTEPLSASEKAQIADRVRECEDAGLAPVISHERLSGYPLTGGYDRLSIWQRIRSLDVECRILLVIREQRSWLYSAWKQMISDGGSVSLRDFLAPPHAASVRLPVPRLEYLDYAREIRTLHSLFGEGNVCVLPHELIATDFDAFAGRLFRFAGMAGAAPSPLRLQCVNESKNLTHLAGLRLLHRFAYRTGTSPGGVLSVNGRLGRRSYALADRLLSRAPRLPWHGAVEAAHRQTIDALVGGRFDHINAATSALVGIDLRDLGYQCPVPSDPPRVARSETLPLRAA
jgi:hypothetical protein